MVNSHPHSIIIHQNLEHRVSQLYFSNAELGQEISISATCDGSIPLNEMPSTVASKVASSTNVDIAEIIAFHSSEVFVLAENSNLIK